jgi:DNA segregation ATPase FtsK/SpoIIIE-like protein
MEQPSKKTGPNETDHLPKNYWQFVTRACLLAAVICIIFMVVPDAPPALKERAEDYLPQVVSAWLILCALPWSLMKLWQHRESLRERWQRWRANRQVVSAARSDQAISSAASPAVAKGDHPPMSAHGDSAHALIPPLTALPPNPNPRPRAAMTMETAGEAISTALQLAEFAVEEDIKVLKVEAGPVLQIVSFQLPPKVQLSKLASKKDDIANHLGPQQGFDVTAAKDFKSAASFVIPHDQGDRAFVYMRDVAPELLAFAEKATLPMILGKDVRGNPMLADLAKMPHLLVCGATGSGKSVSVNTMLTSMISVRSPQQLQLLLIDPKRVEFSVYKGLPHLLAPPVTDVQRAITMFQKVIVEMERRYELFAQTGTRNLDGYNAKHPDGQLPSIVVVIDEYADLMMVAGDVVEDAVQRITQMARAAGIHLIMGTQRPSVNVVTGTIKANLPSRITFKLPNSRDYMTVLDRGAPKLLGFGDGVCMIQGGDLQRFQSAAISVVESENISFIEHLIAYWSSRDHSDYDVSQEWTADEEEEMAQPTGRRQQHPAKQETEGVPWDEPDEKDGEEEHLIPPDPDQEQDIYQSALAIVQEEGGFSVSTIQRQLRIGFSKAAELAEQMMTEGIIGPYDAEAKWRPLIQVERSEEELLQQIRLFICEHRVTRSIDLREQFSIRKEKMLEYMQLLVEEGLLHAPTSTKIGYTIAWTEEEIQLFLEQHN